MILMKIWFQMFIIHFITIQDELFTSRERFVVFRVQYNDLTDIKNYVFYLQIKIWDIMMGANLYCPFFPSPRVNGIFLKHLESSWLFWELSLLFVVSVLWKCGLYQNQTLLGYSIMFTNVLSMCLVIVFYKKNNAWYNISNGVVCRTVCVVRAANEAIVNHHPLLSIDEALCK